MKFSKAFIEMDNFIKTNIHSIVCHEIFEIKKDFYSIVHSLCGNTTNLTGITEMLIFRFLYHALGMNDPIENKAVSNEENCLLIGNRYIGKNDKYQEPDIVVEQNGIIKYLFSIKNLQSTLKPTNHEMASSLVQELINQNGVCTTAIQDIFRIENIRYGKNSSFNSLTIVFSKVPNRHEKAIELVEQKFNWHQFLILENNNNKFIDELEKKVNFATN